MDDSSTKQPKDRAFEPSKVAATNAARRLVARFMERVGEREQRQRARKQVDQLLHLRMGEALVLDLVHRELIDPGLWLSMSLQKARYGTTTRSAPFLTEAFPALLRLLQRDPDFVDFRLGHQGAFGSGKRTTVRAGRVLRGWIEELGLQLSDIGRDPALRGDVIVLKGPKVLGKARKIAFRDTDSIHQMRFHVEEINGWIADADLWWAGDEVEDRIDLGDRFLRRIFNNGTFEEGGRLFGGFWQRAKSDLRLECIQFGDDSAVALDFGQMAVRTAYALVGASPPEGDLYRVPGLERHRDGVKLVLNALLATSEVPSRFPPGTKHKGFPRKWKFEHVYEPIARYHSALRPLFGTGLALKLMHVESQLLVSILLRLKNEGVVALPIHDCVLVGEGSVSRTETVMKEVCKEHLGLDAVVEVKRAATSANTLGTPSVPLQRGA